MSYTISELNSERQHLLAQLLNPVCEPIVRKSSPPTGARCLDLGCGQGSTTRWLHEVWNAAETVGVDFDPNLIDYARSVTPEPSSISYQQGNAMQLDFPDASFDAIFLRYLLVHVPDPDAAIREMLRVVKPGGIIVAVEPDCSYDHAHPPNFGLTMMTKVWHGLFAHPCFGREMYSRFRAAGAANLESGMMSMMGMPHEDQGRILRRIYLLSLEARRPALLARNVLDEATVDRMLADLRHLNDDTTSVIYKFPDVWLVARA